MKKKAVIYTRVSTDEQAKFGSSLRDQEERLRFYCKNNNIEVVAHFQDDYSAKTFKRPEYTKLYEYLKKNRKEIDFLLVARWDRFSRNTSESYKMIDKLESLNVSLQSIESPLDLEVPENRLILAMYLAFPEVENIRRGLNIKMGQRRRIKEGGWP
jgi:DNA invertase Pin-like site-specific DNA recombinase